MPVSQPLHHVGEIVEVRSEAEILATLDENGELDGLPFMPEMLAWCGRRLRVDKLALKLCDTIEWTGVYRIRDTVHLETSRCNGQAHGAARPDATSIGRRRGSSGTQPDSRRTTRSRARRHAARSPRCSQLGKSRRPGHPRPQAEKRDAPAGQQRLQTS